MPRIVISAPDLAPQPYRFPLDVQSVSLGRGSDNDVVIACNSVSSSHAVMERVPGGFQLRDTGSTNGLTVDGQLKALVPLMHGISLKIGDVPFDFSLSDDEQLALAHEATTHAVVNELPEAPPTRPVAPAPGYAHAVSSKESSPTIRFLGTLLFLFLLIAAFFLGLSLKYAKEQPGRTVASLLHDIKASGK